MQPSLARKKGLAVGPACQGKDTKIVALASGDGFALAISVRSASDAEFLLVEEVLAGGFLDELPARRIGDKVYDSDRLDEQLATEYGIELIAPNRRRRRGNSRPTTAAPL